MTIESEIGGEPKFDIETFSSGFSELLLRWKSTWVDADKYPDGRGPTTLRSVIREHLSQQDLDAQRPEDEAKEALLEYSARAILAAEPPEVKRQILAKINEKLAYSFNSMNVGTFAHQLITDIFDRYLEISSR